VKARSIKKIIDAEKIAAGEVVERPANVVKELIENSIDAGASEIMIIIKKAGKALVQVIDNGCGIPLEDMEIAFERHTSSKIRSIKDLDELTTLGFRGEALASIAAVSQVEISSKTEKDARGIVLTLDGGKLIERKEISCSTGTNIKVKNLFYNIPARQKFLKKDTTELGHITDIIQRYSLAYPEIHFIYHHNEIEILNCPSKNDLKTTVFHIYGKKNAEFMELFNYTEEKSDIRIYGLLGHPQIAKKNRSPSSLFINHRYIISDLLFRAIQEAYEGTLMVSKYPFFIIFLEINPSTIDFNVHPKKLHVRFENEEFIYNKFYNVIRSFIEDKFIVKEYKYIATELDNFIEIQEEDLEDTDISKNVQKEVLKEIAKETNINNSDQIINERVQLRVLDQETKVKTEKRASPDTLLREKYVIKENFPRVKLISYTGQLSNKTYIVLEGFNENNEGGLFILDQHAASERIKKEQLISSYESSKPRKQQLISPLKIDVSPTEKIFLLENLNEVKKIGFSFEYFGGNTFILREIPTVIEKVPNVNLIKEVISDVTEIGKDKSFSEVKDEIINYLACHKSIRGGDDLSLKGIRKLIIQLAKCKDSYHCAHGRPTLRFISYKELDKQFKRRV